MSKKTKILIVGLTLVFILLSFGSQIFAQSQCTNADCPHGETIADCCPGGARNPERGLIPCGSACCPCTLCFFFVLIERILEFIFFRLTPPLALLMLIIGGGMFMLATGDPQKISTARRIITSTLIGIVIIYGAFFLVGLLLQSIGLADWTEQIYIRWWEEGVFNINCPVPTTTIAPPAGPGPPGPGGPGILAIPNPFQAPDNPAADWKMIPINKVVDDDQNIFKF